MEKRPTRKLFWALLLTTVVALAVWGFAVFCMIKLWKLPSNDGADMAVVYPLSASGTAVKLGISIALNILSSLLFAASYQFQAAIAAPSKTSMLASIGQFKTICVNNTHIPGAPGLRKGMRRAWYILVVTSILLHSVFNDTVGVSTRYCSTYTPNYYGVGGTYNEHDLHGCRSDLSFRIAPLVIAGALLLVKTAAMQYASRKLNQFAARDATATSLMDVVVAVNNYPGSFRRRSALEDEHELRNRSTLSPAGSRTIRTRQLPIIEFEKAAAWLTGSIGFGSGFAMIGLSSWMLVVWGYGYGPTDGPTTSPVLPGFEVSGYSDSKPFSAYLGTASVAGAPQVMLALITLINLSILEIFYLNKRWSSLEQGTPLGALTHHFKWYKPYSLPAAGHRGRIGIAILVLFPTVGHILAALALSSQELFCETAPAGVGCPYQTGGSFLQYGPNLATMWTTYKLVVNMLFLLLTGIVFVVVTTVVLWIARTRPFQFMPPFYGRPEVADAALDHTIQPLHRETRLRWGPLRSHREPRRVGIDIVGRVLDTSLASRYL